MRKRPSPSDPAAGGGGAPPGTAAPAPDAPGTLSPARLRVALLLLAGLTLYGVAESLLWRDALWGFHFYGFLPRGWLLAVPVTLFFLTPAGAALAFRRPLADGPGAPPAGSAPRWLPWAVAAVAGGLFWTVRERHLYWGDSLPLSILIPQGQAFHPDEPLSLFVHQMLYRVGAGLWSGADAVALGSVLAGAVFAGWSTHWFARRLPRGGVWMLATAVLLTQGFTQLFYGHVENYSYLAVCLLFFCTLGIDFLEARRGLLPALVAALLGFAFHILGGLAAVPALVLVAVGLRDPRRRAGTLVAVTVTLALLVAGSLASSGLYSGESPLSRFLGGFQKVFANRQDFQLERLVSWRQLGNVWSVFLLVGPLSVPLLGALLAILRAAAFARRATGAFLLTGSAVYALPVLLTGEGNLGAARNWDLHAAPAVIWTLCGLALVTASAPAGQVRRLLLGLLAVSLFHTAPWIALNHCPRCTEARVLALPLDPGRAEMMLGTHSLNAGDLPRAERWFGASVARDSANVNSQSGLGLALARQGKYQQALRPLTAAVDLKPASAQLRQDLITLLLELEMWEAAARQLEALLVLEPANRRAWLTLADCRLRLGEPRTAVLTLETGLRHVPRDPEMTSLLGDAYEGWVVQYGRRGDWDAARRALDAFARRFPADPRVGGLRAALPPR